ncbi:MAG TPA: hypothetical protein ENL45_02135 [Candidatus Woesearchaeota archaeon]|nr:hypothetical protein [Candidatus Woesearchaeota archaeon]
MPAVSEKQRRLFAAAYSAKKSGKPKPKYVPDSIWKLPLSKLEEFMVKKKVFKRKVDRSMHDYGEINYSKKIIRVNPRKGDLLNTIIHEELHRQYPNKPEAWIKKKSKKKEANLTISQAIGIMKRYMKQRRKNAN